MRCPKCGGADLVRDSRDLRYAYRGHTTVVAAVAGDYCPACGEGVLDAAESDRPSAEMLAFNRQVDVDTFDPVRHGGELMAFPPVGKEFGAMRAYRVTMHVESGGSAEDDPVIEKTVEAADEAAALGLAKSRVRDENPELNYMKIWAWGIERVPR